MTNTKDKVIDEQNQIAEDAVKFQFFSQFGEKYLENSRKNLDEYYSIWRDMIEDLREFN